MIFETVACDCLGLLVNAPQYVNADISEGIWVQGEPFLAGSSEETCDFSPLTALFISSFPLCSLRSARLPFLSPISRCHLVFVVTFYVLGTALPATRASWLSTRPA